MNSTRLQELFQKHFDRTATAPEMDELDELLRTKANDEEFKRLLAQAWENYKGDGQLMSDERTEALIEHVLGKRQAPVRKMKVWRYVAAAAILVFVIGGYFIITNKKTTEPVIANNKVEDVNPGSYKAKLRLADGREIILDSATLGELAKQGNTSVINKDGQLVYSGNGGEVLYNTVSTAKGETYAMTLADGSKVWLNSGSSIHFPVAFNGKERRIEVTGEVYVKVAKNKNQPFIASANGMEVLALGTEFNINSYSDEDNISATLIEGSVKVNSTVTLNPGQQTQLTGGKLSAARQVNVDEITAWKEGIFHFESADLKTILKQLSRWYDIEVLYEGPVSNEKFFSIMNRNTTLSNMLKSLQANDVKFRIEGKKLYVGK